MLSQAPFVELLGNSWTHSLSEGGYGFGPYKRVRYAPN